jgi:hypothetical protein
MYCVGKAYIYRDPDFASIFPDGEAADLDDGDLCDQGDENYLPLLQIDVLSDFPP